MMVKVRFIYNVPPHGNLQMYKEMAFRPVIGDRVFINKLEFEVNRCDVKLDWITEPPEHVTCWLKEISK